MAPGQRGPQTSRRSLDRQNRPVIDCSTELQRRECIYDAAKVLSPRHFATGPAGSCTLAEAITKPKTVLRKRHGRRTLSKSRALRRPREPDVGLGGFPGVTTREDQESAARRVAARSSAPGPSAHLCRPQYRPCPRLGRRVSHPTQSAGRRPEQLLAVGHPREPGHRRETEVRPGRGRRPGSAHRPLARRPCRRSRHPRVHTPHLPHRLRRHRQQRVRRQLRPRRLHPPSHTCMRRRPFSAGPLLHPGSAL
jgi:hypothetical protein